MTDDDGPTLYHPIPDNIPRPDPTVRTTEQLHRELGSLREIIETRLHGMDHASTIHAKASEAAVSKAEAGFVKDLDGLKVLLNTNITSIGAQIADISARITRSEVAATTVREVKTDNQTSIGTVIGIIGGVIGVLGFMLALALGLSNFSRLNAIPAPAITVQQPAATGLISPSGR